MACVPLSRGDDCSWGTERLASHCGCHQDARGFSEKQWRGGGGTSQLGCESGTVRSLKHVSFTPAPRRQLLQPLPTKPWGRALDELKSPMRLYWFPRAAVINTLNWELQTTDIHPLTVLGAERPMPRCQQGPGEGLPLLLGLLAAPAAPWPVDSSPQSPLLSSQVFSLCLSFLLRGLQSHWVRA